MTFMATEALKLTAQIVISHASMSELTPKELVDEIKSIYNVLSALETGEDLFLGLVAAHRLVAGLSRIGTGIAGLHLAGC